MVMDIFQKIEKESTRNMARLVVSDLRSAYDCGMRFGHAFHNPATPVLTERKKREGDNFPAAETTHELLPLLQAINTVESKYQARHGLQLQAMLMCRPGELIKARWADVDFQKREWLSPLSKHGAKRQRKLIVPLPRQAIDVLRRMHDRTGKSEFVFLHRDKRQHLPHGNFMYHFRKSGIDWDTSSLHGFRATGRTILAQQPFGYRIDWLEHQLGHVVRDVNGTAYNRATFLEERRGMMQVWADEIDRIYGGSFTAL